MNKKWSEILQVINGKHQKNVENANGKYPIYGSGGIIGHADSYLCEAGTTIIGRKGTINSPIYVNKQFWNVDTAFGVAPLEGLNSKYLYFFCLHFNFKVLDKSTTIPSLAKRDLLNIEMPVPPLLEQERIVARIEELFSQLDAGVAELITTKKRLKVYRQAVLKEAFSSDNATKTVEISEIVDDIRIGPFGTMLHKSDYVVGGIPVVNPQHIKNNSNIPGATVTISAEKADKLSAYRLRKNDIIMGRRGEMGRTAPITDNENGWICGTGSILFRIKTDFDALFYSQILSGPDVVHYLEEHATGTTMKNLNDDIVQHIPVPYMTVEMQEKMTADMDSKMSICDSIELTVETSLQQVDALRQSILKQAFEGRL